MKRVSSKAVALETTLLVHGVPKDAGLGLSRELEEIVRGEGAEPGLVGVISGRPCVGVNKEELAEMIAAGTVQKTNTSNLGYAFHAGLSAATTVSTTMEIASFAGLRVFATGGIGGVHRGYGTQLDISADLVALTRYPMAVVTSGVKSILDVEATREALETLGITVVGFGTSRFPAFYLRDGGCDVDIRFDDPGELADFVRGELPRTGRGIVIANPIPEADEIDHDDWSKWLGEAQQRAESMGAKGRDVTPAVLSGLHEISEGRTLAANIALIKSNARLAARVASRL